MSDLIFSVTGDSSSATKFEGKARHFNFTVDEPEALGGTDVDLNPVEYILAGFAGCINVVGHLVAKELNFEINSLKINVSGGINPNKFLGISQKERSGFKEITLNLIVDADIDQQTLEKWKNIVEERCPVKDNLLSITPVNVSFHKEREFNEAVL